MPSSHNHHNPTVINPPIPFLQSLLSTCPSMFLSFGILLLVIIYFLVSIYRASISLLSIHVYLSETTRDHWNSQPSWAFLLKFLACKPYLWCAPSALEHLYKQLSWPIVFFNSIYFSLFYRWRSGKLSLKDSLTSPKCHHNPSPIVGFPLPPSSEKFPHAPPSPLIPEKMAASVRRNSPEETSSTSSGRWVLPTTGSGWMGWRRRRLKWWTQWPSRMPENC